MPSMQNYLFPLRDSAMNARMGSFELIVCDECGFAFNDRFDPGLIDYDAGYDNSVPSQVMHAYYRELSAYIFDRYADRGDCLIVDVGCGKGTFLEVFCNAYPTARGLGIDATYEGADTSNDGRVSYVRDFFAERHIVERPSVVVCRHVLEHIHDPFSFLRSISSALGSFPNTPVFIEVPDITWIVKNRAFWDFCYEHCNYFNEHTLSELLDRAGFPRPHVVRHLYEGQYLSIEKDARGRAPHEATTLTRTAVNPSAALVAYSRFESDLIAAVSKRLHKLKSESYQIALWGMATKGVDFAFLIDRENNLLNYCIDINPARQGGYVPVTGHLIEPPVALRRAGSSPIAVVVMNPNYAAEIRATCAELSVTPIFLGATSEPL